jgi:hypothetical protein
MAGTAAESRAHDELVLAGRARAAIAGLNRACPRKPRVFRKLIDIADTFPFVRLTRAYLNLQVKDQIFKGRRPPETAGLWRVLEFKFQIRFSAAMG